MKSYPIYILIALFAFASCNNKATNDPSNDSPQEKVNVQEGEKADESKMVPLYLEGIYATSTRIPASRFQVSHLFDMTPYSYYSTMPGAAPDEGFMLYFGDETYIDEVYLTTVWDSTMMNFKKVVLYGDGQMIGPRETNKAIEIKKEISSLYVRIADHMLVSKVDRKLDNAIDQTSAIFNFPTSQSIGIGEFQLKGKDGVSYKIIPPAQKEGSVTASSTLSPQEAYSVNQLFDSRKEFVWVEGAENSGEGESITFTFKEDVQISAIKIRNGYQRSSEHYKANARVKQFAFGNDADLVNYKLKDKSDNQLIKLKKPLKGKSFTMKINSVFPGKTYKDLAISELLFFDGERPFVVKTNHEERSKKRSISKIKNSVLSSILDRRISNYDETEENYVQTLNRSLILRSNNTFVYYENMADDSGFYQDIVADGNWELLEKNDQEIKVKIFGRNINLTEIDDFYSGNSSNKSIRIFKDVLTISENKIEGEQLITAPLFIK